MEKTDLMFNFDGQMLDRLPLQIRPVTEIKHSTGTDPANMPRNSAASCCRLTLGNFFPRQSELAEYLKPKEFGLTVSGETELIGQCNPYPMANEHVLGKYQA